jgi:16S rRNA (guanine527-N7)-methyltransferase
VFHVKPFVRRLRELTERHGLNERQHEQLSELLDLLAREEQAPTAVRGPEQAVNVHLADSLTALELDVVRRAEKIADLGAGAGFPGLPLAIALPKSEIRLIESQARKCAFIGSMSDAVEAKNTRVICARAEEWHEGVGHNDVVVARALAPQPVVLEYAAPLLRLGGALVDWRGRRNAEEETGAACAAEQLGLRLLEIRHTEPYESARHHHLHVYVKAEETPPRFPRRVGVARKRPIGC